MASNQNKSNNTGSQQNKNEEKSGGGWFVPAILGAAVGAGLAYMFSKPQSCSEQRHTNSSCGQGSYEAAPRGCCSICREDYDATITLQCGHILHRDCYEEMKRFSRGTVLCPLCRKRAE